MSDHDDRREKESGGASPAHHASSGDGLAPVITLHHRTDTHHPENGPVVVEGEIVDQTCGPQTGTTSTGTAVVSRRDIYRSDLHAAGRGAIAVATHPIHARFGHRQQPQRRATA